MCGILASIGIEVEPQDFAAALELMAHRGPDSRRVSRVAPGVTFGFARLAIIDLDERADQPITHGPVTLMLNGEVYNYLELRRRLEADGLAFRTTGDAEVMAAAIHHWGAERALKEARGMWGLVAHDRRDGSVLVARDRLGIKPLYWARWRNALVFASEPKAILSLVPELRQVDAPTLSRYLVAGALEQHDQSFFSGIRQVPKAHWALVGRDCDFRPQPYWSIDPSPAGATIAQVGATFTEVMTQHLRSDVPIGVALSGGFDSTLIASYLRRDDVRYYSVRTGSEVGEAPLIDATVRDWGLNHSYVEVEDADAEALSERMISVLDQPFKTAQSLHQMAIRIRAAADGVRVFLTGDGADEVFGGYRHCLVPLLAGLVRHGHWLTAINLAGRLQEFSGRRQVPLLRDAVRRAAAGAVRPFPLEDLRQRREAQWVASALVDALSEPEPAERAADLKSHLLFRLQTEGVPYWLRVEDGLSMSVGMETRVPFLDHVLVERGLAFPDQEYFADGRNKSILRRATEGLLPPHIADRVQKAQRPGSTRRLIFQVLWHQAIDDFASARAGSLLDRGAADRFRADWETGRNEGFWFRAWLAIRWMKLCVEGRPHDGGR
jgi:asparagine synthase (glutamine-hydrolysing)